MTSQNSQPTEVRADLVPRLRAIGARYRDSAEETALLRRQRDEIVVEAVDEGIAQRTVAAEVGLKSQSQVVAICARSQPDAAAS